MTLAERLTATHAKAARLYLRRQDIEVQRQQLTQQAQALDVALVKTDGEVAMLEALIEAEKAVVDGV